MVSRYKSFLLILHTKIYHFSALTMASYQLFPISATPLRYRNRRQILVKQRLGKPRFNIQPLGEQPAPSEKYLGRNKPCAEIFGAAHLEAKHDSAPPQIAVVLLHC